MSWLTKYYQYKAIVQSGLSVGLTADEIDALGYVKWNSTDSSLTADGVTVSDTLSVTNITDLPTASTKSGKTYIVTATPSAWYSNGTSWYQIGGNEPMLTWANFPAASAVAFGTAIRINPSSFGGTYKNAMGILMVSDGTNWRPKNGRQTMAMASSEYASPFSSCTVVGATDTLFDIATNFSMPAGLLNQYEGMGIYVKALFAKTGADTALSTFRVKMGKNNSTAADIIYSGSTGANALRQYKIDQECRITNLGAAGGGSPTGSTAKFTTDTLQGNSQDIAKIFDRTQYLDTTLVNYIVFTADNANNATHGLVSFSIELLA